MFDIKEIGMVPPPYGGVSVYLRRLISELSRDGFSVGGYYNTTSDLLIKESKLFNKWSWFETASFPWKIFKYLIQLREYRLVHSHMGLEAMIYLWTIKKVLRKQMIITVHNSMVQDYFEKTNKINKFFLRMIAREKDIRWVAVSNETKSQMLELPIIFRSKIDVIPAYIPERQTESRLSDSMQSYLCTHKRNLLFYGHSFMSNKGCDIYGFKEMLRIFQLVKRSQCDTGLVYCLADTSDPVAIDEIVQFAKQLEIYDDVFWQLGSLKSMSPLWEVIDVYVRPTSTDGDSVAIREALGAGAQVVASDVCLRPKNCIVFAQGDTNSAYKAINHALSIGRTFATKDFSYYEMMRSVYLEYLKKQNWD